MCGPGPLSKTKELALILPIRVQRSVPRASCLAPGGEMSRGPGWPLLSCRNPLRHQVLSTLLWGEKITVGSMQSQKQAFAMLSGPEATWWALHCRVAACYWESELSNLKSLFVSRLYHTRECRGHALMSPLWMRQRVKWTFLCLWYTAKGHEGNRSFL